MKHLTARKPDILPLYAAAVALLLFAAVTGILLGATRLQFGDAVNAKILLYVRLPRVLGAILCGGALAVSGAVIQVVLQNRLASPSIIGVNAGAGLAVTICAALGILGGWRMSLCAFLGAFATVMAVSLGAKKWGASRGTVILMGVALNSLLGAAGDGLAVLIPEVNVMKSDFRVGDFSGVTYPKLIPAAVLILAAILVLQTLTNELDLLTLGEDSAKSLGLPTNLMRPVFLLLAAALAGAAVSLAGLVSFVGLLVPHGVRRFSGSGAKHLLPLCALFGAGFVTCCDTLSRWLFAPYELPVGILLAAVGAPFFLVILLKKGGRGYA